MEVMQGSKSIESYNEELRVEAIRAQIRMTALEIKRIEEEILWLRAEGLANGVEV